MTMSEQNPTSNTSNSDVPMVGLVPAAYAPSKQEADDNLPAGVEILPVRDFAIPAQEELLTSSPDSPLRIVVRCLSHKIPGHRSNRTTTMANIICQYHFQRDIDREKEQIRSLGLTEIDGKKVRFLFECGTISPDTRVEDVPIKIFKWNGNKLYDPCLGL